MTEEGPRRTRIAEGLETFVDEAEAAVKSALRRSDTIGENLKETIQGALSSRKNVVMVRLNEASLQRVDDLVESGVVKSRSEASAFLIGEGIKARADIFARIGEKIDTIRAARQELRDLMDETPPDEPAAESEETDQPAADEAPNRQE
jgi:Arc/MetJ-type ribon-helix-helix transcriptional regulator